MVETSFQNINAFFDTLDRKVFQHKINTEYVNLLKHNFYSCIKGFRVKENWEGNNRPKILKMG